MSNVQRKIIINIKKSKSKITKQKINTIIFGLLLLTISKKKDPRESIKLVSRSTCRMKLPQYSSYSGIENVSKVPRQWSRAPMGRV